MHTIFSDTRIWKSRFFPNTKLCRNCTLSSQRRKSL